MLLCYQPTSLTNKEWTFIRDVLDLTIVQFNKLLQIDYKTLETDTILPPIVDRMIRIVALDDLQRKLQIKLYELCDVLNRPQPEPFSGTHLIEIKRTVCSAEHTLYTATLNVRGKAAYTLDYMIDTTNNLNKT